MVGFYENIVRLPLSIQGGGLFLHISYCYVLNNCVALWSYGPLIWNHVLCVTLYDFLDAGHSTWLKRLQCDVVLSVG